MFYCESPAAFFAAARTMRFVNIFQWEYSRYADQDVGFFYMVWSDWDSTVKNAAHFNKRVFEIERCWGRLPKKAAFFYNATVLNAMRMLSYCIFPVIPYANIFIEYKYDL